MTIIMLYKTWWKNETISTSQGGKCSLNGTNWNNYYLLFTVASIFIFSLVCGPVKVNKQHDFHDAYMHLP